MTFDEWWKTLTTKEQNMIGVNNARFIWGSACEACAKICDDLWQEDKTAYECREAIRKLGKPT